MATAAPRRVRQFDLILGESWPCVLGFAVLAIPTIVTLADQVWSQESGAHGPIILAVGAWLLWRQGPAMKRLAAPGNPWLTMAILTVALALYVFGRAYDFISLETAGVYGAGVAMLHAGLGVRALLKSWFPFLYLAFCIPPPTWLLDHLTSPLKHFVSFASTELLSQFGVPIARQGVTIIVAQYQLLVEDACSGLNSIIGISAISILYIYLRRGQSAPYALLLLAFVIPIAIVANVLRIVLILLLTYFFGDAVAQGYAHFAAGIFLFATSLALVFAVDELIFRALPRLRRSG